MKVTIRMGGKQPEKKTAKASSRAFRFKRISSDIWTEPVELRSSNLQSTRYNPDVKQLEITFKDGRVYLYSNVPVHVWDTLISAASPGRYFSRIIKPSYMSTKR